MHRNVHAVCMCAGEGGYKTNIPSRPGRITVFLLQYILVTVFFHNSVLVTVYSCYSIFLLQYSCYSERVCGILGALVVASG